MIDDSPEDRSYLKRLLGPSEEWRFTETSTAAEGLELLTERSFHCLLVDYRLPDSTGIEVLQSLAQSAGGIKLAAILLTAAGDETLAAQAIKVGAMDYLSKRGLTRQSLRHAVCNAIEKYHLVAEREKALQDLRRSELRFQTIAATVPGVLFTNRIDGACDYVNAALYEFTGMPAGSLEGWGWASALHPDDLERCSQTWRKCVSQGTDYEDVYRLRRHDGVYRWFKSTAKPLRADGSIIGWFGISTDIQDQKDMQAELQLRSAALQRSNDELNRFGYTISHDLQSPLRTISGMTKLICQRLGDRLDDDTAGLMSEVQSGVSRMSQLIHDLLEYARTSEQPRRLVPIEARGLVGWALMNLQAQVEESGAEINVGPLPTILGSDQLASVFQNLIGNSIKYRAARPLKITISAERQQEEWVFAVRDNGLGFEMQHAERVFGAFTRLHSAKEYSGTGIGLAICKRVVERHDGRIWTESEPGAGTTFYFALPTVAFNETSVAVA